VEVDNKVFRDAVAELESLGFRVSQSAHFGARAYAVIPARSNERWWLIPLASRALFNNGMALFQPVTKVAKFTKKAGSVINAFGLSSLFFREKLFVSEESCLSKFFPGERLHYAFFTGTDGPHRKTTIQVMNEKGAIRGFAKVTKNTEIKSNLAREAEALSLLETADLATANVPSVIYFGDVLQASMLVTDTLKTAAAKTVLNIRQPHVQFLAELRGKTALINGGRSLDSTITSEMLQERYSEIVMNMPERWRGRINAAIEKASRANYIDNHGGLQHGDFTPWNTFFIDGRLYVFDWEYADRIYPYGYDFIHFSCATLNMSGLSPGVLVNALRTSLISHCQTKSLAESNACLLNYFCSNSLFLYGRHLRSGATHSRGLDLKMAAGCIDYIISGE